MNFAISILFLLVFKQASAQTDPIHGFGHRIKVTGNSIEELELQAQFVGAQRCSSMFYGFGELHEIVEVSVEERNTCSQDYAPYCEETLVGVYETLCALNLPDFENGVD